MAVWRNREWYVTCSAFMPLRPLEAEPWTAAEQELLDWLQMVHPPAAPFWLWPGIYVPDPILYWVLLRQRVAATPCSQMRVALLHEIQRLKETLP